MAAPTATTALKKHQPTTANVNQFKSKGVSKYTQGKNYAEVWSLLGLQSSTLSKKRLWHRCFSMKLLRTRLFIEHLRTTTSETAQDFTKNGPKNNS